jgi:hypothetical protein
MNLPDVKAQFFRQLGERMKLDRCGAVAELLDGYDGSRRRHCGLERLEQETPRWNMRLLLSLAILARVWCGCSFHKMRYIFKSTSER